VRYNTPCATDTPVLPPKAGRYARRSPWLRLAFLVLAVVLFAAGYYWGNQYKKPETAQVEAAILLRMAMPLPDFEALDHTGERISNTTLQANWGLLLIGALDTQDTRAGLALMNRVYNRLAAWPELQQALRPLLISPHADRDTPELLQQTVQAYNPGMLAASADSATLAGLQSALHAESRSNLYLLDPQVRIQAMFTLDTDPATIARDIVAIHAAYVAP